MKTLDHIYTSVYFQCNNNFSNKTKLKKEIDVFIYEDLQQTFENFNIKNLHFHGNVTMLKTKNYNKNNIPFTYFLSHNTKNRS